MALTDTFRALHADGSFTMPNPWDRGSARILEEMGFPALATTSAGFGRAIGKNDQEVTRDELVTHVADLTAFISVPLNIDSERLFPDDHRDRRSPQRRPTSERRHRAAGCSIEDYNPATKAIDPIEAATEATAIAAAACAEHGLVLTARTENHLYGVTDLDDTIARLVAFRDVGAEVAYAPGLTTPTDIARVVETVGIPLNVLAMPAAPSAPDLAALGVRRMSIGSSLYNAAQKALKRGATELLESGTSTYLKS